MTTFYKKVGKRYFPVSEYDSDLLSAYPEGTHLTICIPGKSSRRYYIEPAFAPMIAAGSYAEEAIVQVIMEKLSLSPQKYPLTIEQKKAWENFKEVMGEDRSRLSSGSIMEAVRAGVNAMAEVAAELLENPALQNSYDSFILLSKLTRGK
jgi:hypothetical protein